ncbi:MAG TPA: hypothetical protein PK467_08930, partial [Candidatus Wallbacteria bacterium]|nr:hypothetical protein [Candidatus Wallbacteria bacterium]
IVFNYDVYRLSDMKFCTSGRTRHAFIGTDGRVLKNDPDGKVKALADLLKRYHESKAAGN